MYMSNRLKAYLAVFARLPPSLESRTFRQALVNLYVHILDFLAQAICTQKKNSVHKLGHAVWNTKLLAQFEDNCNILCARAAEEARICDSHMGEQWRQRLDTRLQSLDRIHRSFTGLHDKADLAKLVTAGEATYDSAAEGELPRCLQDTRVELLRDITRWATATVSERIFWLCGKAGTGKSTIARTVAQGFDDNGCLGASFFFKRGRADRSRAKLVFPTIARQLAGLSPELGHAIANALDHDALICDKHLKPQFDKLLLQPLQNASQTGVTPASIVIVIDALDECESSEDIKTILLLLSRIKAVTLISLRIFVTSRPELPVELGFKGMAGDLHYDVRLEEAQQTTIERDIHTFYDSRFNDIREESLSQDDELPPQWPGEDNVNFLVKKGVPLFIFAFTVTRFISSDPRNNLALMVQQSQDNALSGLEATYLPILDQIVVSIDDAGRRTRVQRFQSIVGSIILFYDPLSASALAQLLQVDEGIVGRTLRPLHSVLNVPRTVDDKLDRTKPITLFHLSFRDFLVDPGLRNVNKVWVNAAETHSALYKHCIQLLESGSLRQDVCSVLKPGKRRGEMEKSILDASLPEAVRYACRY